MAENWGNEMRLVRIEDLRHCLIAAFERLELPREEWVRGLPWAFGVGRYDRKRLHWASERSVRYGFLIGDSERNYPNPHLYQKVS